MEEKALSIYLHWPFCLSKCPYCDFMSVPVQKDSTLFEKYGELLLEDLKKSLEQIDYPFRVNTIFFGGGTPSLMSPRHVEKILDFLQDKTSSDIEISLEANPATFNMQQMRDFQNAGINRISLGIQSFSDTNLQFLGRIYNSSEALSAAEIVATVFHNFSFDFIYGYECQTADSFEQDLKTAVSFDCKHISCYQLTFEKGTPFYEKMRSGIIKTISEDKEIQLYKFAADFLESYEIFRYEISNYAKKNFECKHNLSYWNYCDYLGVGPSAHGRIKIGKRKCATEKIRDPFKWANAVERKQNAYSVFLKLKEEEILQEILIMKLRLYEGLDLPSLYRNVSKDIADKIITDKKLEFLRSNNFISVNGRKKINLTAEGMMKLNSIIDFLCE